ncbi:MAG: hypothetical protein ICV60_16625 [Pyrinomonadaceae bacterium]|nr:hypothetical protein [Pyrinomonadaceae bacterium]
MAEEEAASKLELIYTLLCDDVRLEVGNKLSFMGVFHNIIVQQVPVRLFKFAVINHWQGTGEHVSEVRILTPDRRQPVALSQPTNFEIGPSGFADNISFFIDVTFPEAGRYWVQTLVNSTLFHEQPLVIAEFQMPPSTDEVSEAVN